MASHIQFLQKYVEELKEVMKKGDYQKAQDMASVIEKDAYRTKFWRSISPEEREILSEVSDKARQIRTEASKLWGEELRKKHSYTLRQIASILPEQLEKQLKLAATIVGVSDDQS